MRKLIACALLFGSVACSEEASSPSTSNEEGGTSNASAGTGNPSGGSVAQAGASAGSVAGMPSAGSAGGGIAGMSGGTDGAGAMAGSGGNGDAAQLPAELLDLGNWKLTLPIGDAESPTEIKQPELASYELAPYFHLDALRQAVLFQARVDGVTTSGSDYPRCELREMMNEGADNAAWSMTSGTHSMTIRQAITQLPVVKAHVVAGQIHDAEDDVVMIRLEGEHLFVEGGGEELGDLNPSYQLGTEFTVRIVASAGVIQVFYDDLSTPKVEVPSQATECYFKAGVYTQSNPEHGDEPTAYGEVAIYDLEVTHE